MIDLFVFTPVTETDINNWNHPAKKVFQDNNVEIVKVELLNISTYPIFYVKLPYKANLDDEALITELFDRVASSNGYWDYEIKDEAQYNFLPHPLPSVADGVGGMICLPTA